MSTLGRAGEVCLYVFINISIENMQVYDNEWLPLNNNPLLDLNILPNTNEDLILKLAIPRGTLPGEYNGVITVTSMEG